MTRWNRAVGLVVGLVACGGTAYGATPCEVSRPRIEAAFARRLGRDVGNVLLAHAAAVPEGVAYGIPSGAAEAEPLMRKVARIWWHTDSKIRRKCSDAEAVATYGMGEDVATVTDALFVQVGLPWVRRTLDVLGPGASPRCLRTTFRQLGRAERDQMRARVGRPARWGFYLRDVDALCGAGMAQAVRAVTESAFAPGR